MPRRRLRQSGCPSLASARHGFACLVVLLTAAAGAGCGEKEEDVSTAAATATSTEAENTLPSVDIVSRDYLFAAPSRFEGGWVTLNFENQGAEPHEYALARLAGGHTYEEVAELFEESGGSARDFKPPPWFEDVGNVGGLQTPGAMISLTRIWEPGEYAWLCFLPTAEGESHIDLGMHAGFTVVEPTTAAAPPDADAELVVTEDGFTVPENLGSGEQTLEVRSAGPKSIDVELVRFEEGQDLRDLNRWGDRGFVGEPAAELLGGAFLPNNDPFYLTAEFESGATYDFVNPDTQAQGTVPVESR